MKALIVLIALATAVHGQTLAELEAAKIRPRQNERMIVAKLRGGRTRVTFQTEEQKANAIQKVRFDHARAVAKAQAKLPWRPTKGDSGIIPHMLQVLQVIDSENMLVERVLFKDHLSHRLGESYSRESGRITYWLATDTTGYTDEQWFYSQTVWKSWGTKQYDTASGSTRTVPALVEK